MPNNFGGSQDDEDYAPHLYPERKQKQSLDSEQTQAKPVIELSVTPSLISAAERQGVPVEDLVKRWLQEKLDDDMRRRLLEAAGANTPDPSLIHEETCAVTTFDMKVRLMSDGRKRGLWVFLKDQSPDRERWAGSLNQGALLEWPQAKKLYAAMGKALKTKARKHG